MMCVCVCVLVISFCWSNFRCRSAIRLHTTNVYTHSLAERNGMQTHKWKFSHFQFSVYTEKIWFLFLNYLVIWLLRWSGTLQFRFDEMYGKCKRTRECMNDGCMNGCVCVCVCVRVYGRSDPLRSHFHVQSHARIVQVNITQRIYVIWLFQ